MAITNYLSFNHLTIIGFIFICTTTHGLDLITQALRGAIKQRNIKSVTYYLNKGAKIETIDENGHNTLHAALLSNCNSEIFLFLLEKNDQLPADRKLSLDAQDNEGNTLLFLATQRLKLKIIKALLERHVDLLRQNNKCQTPLEYLLNDYWTEFQNYHSVTQEKYHTSLTLLCDALINYLEQQGPTSNLIIAVFSHESIFDNDDCYLIDELRGKHKPAAQQLRHCLPVRFLRQANLPNDMTHFKIMTKDEFDALGS